MTQGDSPRPGSRSAMDPGRRSPHRAPDRWADLGPRPWLVLGGGGVKGMAHVGVWRWLREQGRDVKGVIGCSIGSLVGACICAGMDVWDMVRIAKALERKDIIRINRRAAWVNGLKAQSLFRGETLMDYIRRTLPVSDWSDLSTPLQVNAVDLATGEAHWFGAGGREDVGLLDAVYASSALPVFYPPANMGGSWFVDGGVDQALPLDRARAVDATGIIAVDCGSGPSADPAKVVGQGMVAIHHRVMSIMIRRRRTELQRTWDALPMALIRPDLDGYDTFDFDSVPHFLEAGYQAAKDRLGPTAGQASS